MKLIFWDKKAETYHREENVKQCVTTQTIIHGRNRNCYVLFFKDGTGDKMLFKNNYELERIEE